MNIANRKLFKFVVKSVLKCVLRMNVRSTNLSHPKVNITRCSISGIFLYLAQMNVTICIPRKTLLLFIISSIRESPKHEAYLNDSGNCII